MKDYDFMANNSMDGRRQEGTVVFEEVTVLHKH